MAFTQTYYYDTRNPKWRNLTIKEVPVTIDHYPQFTWSEKNSSIIIKLLLYYYRPLQFFFGSQNVLSCSFST
jgi:hypothetical protein